MNKAFAKSSVILIVEYEFLLRMHAAEMIQEVGFDSVEAANANEAIANLESLLNSSSFYRYQDARLNE